jgi:hypothetical protein
VSDFDEDWLSRKLGAMEIANEELRKNNNILRAENAELRIAIVGELEALLEALLESIRARPRRINGFIDEGRKSARYGRNAKWT